MDLIKEVSEVLAEEGIMLVFDKDSNSLKVDTKIHDGDVIERYERDKGQGK